MAKSVDTAILRHAWVGRAGAVDRYRVVEETFWRYLVTDELIRCLRYTVLYLQLIALWLGDTMLLSQLAS